MTKLISLIIPIYNVEAYIYACLSSVIDQLSDAIEVILVNDGTPDQSMEIIIELLKGLSLEKQTCFQILQQENQGQSVARNHALAIATGEYIAFLDADDVLEEDYFSVLFSKIKLYHPDIIQFKGSRFHDDLSQKITFHVGAKLQGLYENSDQIQQHVFNQSAWFPWLNIYKRSLFTAEILFPIGVYYEDAAVVPQLFLKAKHVLFIENYLYAYRYNPTGSLMNISAKNIEKHIYSFKYIIDFYSMKLKSDSIFSPNLVALTQGYISFLLKHKGIKTAFLVYQELHLQHKPIDLTRLEKRGNILFYKFGPAFLLFAQLIGRE